jgi:hypothetical protein
MKTDDPDSRKAALAAEKQSLLAKLAAIDAKNESIQKGEWTGPGAPLSPTSIYVAPAPAIMQVQPSPQKPP